MRTCTVCHQNFPEFFLPLPLHYFETANKLNLPHSFEDGETLNLGQYTCPICGSSDRDRLYALYITTHIKTSPDKELKILEIAPAHGLSNFIKARPNTIYRSADLYSSLVSIK